MEVNSYDKNAPRPKVDSVWVWEIDNPYSRALIKVTEVIWNGEEWWVRTETLLAGSGMVTGIYSNDLSRFWEACVPVLPKITGRLDQFTDNGPIREKAETA